MTFLSAPWLWLLLGVAALAAAYIVLQRRRGRYAVRFTNLDLLDVVAPERPSWRRHLPAAALLLGLASLVVAMARPAQETQVPRERATIMLAVDVSISMRATDVRPSRIEAAKQAATEFVASLPDQLNVGLVEFAGQASVMVSPTTDHEQVERAIESMELQNGTAIGEAVFASLDAITSAPESADGEATPGRIVLLSDGVRNQGRTNDDASAAAQEAGVSVSTIAYGTDEGEIELGDRIVPVPVDRDALRALAEQTSGSYFEAASGSELKQVYENIGSAIGYDTENREVGRWFTGAGLAVIVAAAVMSLAWFSRLP
jgi:Ca-activated chloride channel family protein